MLEPNENIIAKNYQEVLFKQGIPAASLETNNLDEEYHRLMSLDVKFAITPSDAFGIRYAIFEDKQGNLIQIVETEGK